MFSAFNSARKDVSNVFFNVAFSAALISELKRVEIQKLTFVFVLAYFLKNYDNKAICELKLNLKQSFKR